jgi:serine/threonine-protein kinase
MKLCPTCRTKYPDDANFCPQESCATPDGPQRLQPAPDGGKPRFQPLSRIGGASTGEVWKAKDTETSGEVAYKIIGPEVLPTATAQSRAEREFKQLMRVQSPRVATVIDSGRTPDGRLYVAMELVQGEPLERMLRTGPLPFDKAKSIVGQVGQALLEAQKAGIVHRDVAPKNVLVAPSGDVKVINFPIARPLTDKVSGVPAYVSPEQAQGKPVDQRSNTYSLACIFYQLLTGEPPFQAPTPQGVLELHVSSPPLPPSQRRPEANLSPDIDRVILKALDKNSSRRHLTLRLFLTEIDALTAPGAAAPAVGAAPAPGREVAFAKTMLFAGGQAEVASLVAKAIAARTGGTPAAGSPLVTARAAQPAAAQVPAPAAMPTAAAVASTLVATPSPAPAPAASPVVATAATPAEGAPVVVAAPAASPAPRAAAPAPAAEPAEKDQGKDKGKKGKAAAFRETLWFKKGEADQMVADAKAKLAAKGAEAEAAAPAEDIRPIEDRYIDDGTVTTEDRKKFSLRTGGTATALPAVGRSVPGEGMSEKDVIDEIAGTRRTMILVLAGVVVAALVVVLMLMMSRKTPKPAPAAAPHAAEVAPPAPGALAPAAAVAGGDSRPAAEPTKKKSAPSTSHTTPADLLPA